MYTLQLDSHGNAIVCRGDDVRNGYSIFYRGTYDACNAMRPEAVAQVRRAAREANYARLGLTFTAEDAALCGAIDAAAARNRITWNGTTRNA